MLCFTEELQATDKMDEDTVEVITWIEGRFPFSQKSPAEIPNCTVVNGLQLFAKVADDVLTNRGRGPYGKLRTELFSVDL